MDKIWFSFLSSPLKNNNQNFYDAKSFPWVDKIEDNWEVIKNEIASYVSHNKEIKPYFNEKLTVDATKWKSFALLVWGWKKNKNIKQCLKTYELLNNIEGLVSASISILDPETIIKPHFGDTNAIMRCHLGLIIPGQLPYCGIEVGGIQKSWEEGKLIIFDDSQTHSAWNNTKQTRIVMIIDVVRKEFLDKKYFICSTILSKLLLQSVLNKFPVFKKLPKKIILNNVLKVNAFIIRIVLRIRSVHF